MSFRRPTLTICGLLLLLTTTTSASELLQTQFTRGAITLEDGYKIELEIADTQALRERGLMHRAALDEGHGMLFVYPETARQGVWMKNTLIALDVLFLSKHGQVTEILENLQPCKTDPCPIYLSDTKASYMLEVPAGFVAKRHIDPDQQFILEYRHASNGD